MSFNLFINILLFFPLKINNSKINPCLAVQECKIDLSYSSESKIKCSEHGKCFYDLYDYIIKKNEGNTIEFLKCVCDEGYISLNDRDEVKCCYKQKLQLNAILYELFSFGFGHLYIGNKILFYIKFSIECILIIIILICFCFSSFNNKNNSNYDTSNNKNNYSNEFLTTKEMILNSLGIICVNIIIIWQIIDLTLYGVNFYTDENGVPLKNW